MVLTIVHVNVKPERLEDFKKATIENYEHSVKEPGNMRFDILQDKETPTKFFLYEAYSTEEDALKHKETAHYLKWKQIVQDFMAGPRQGIKYTVIRP